MDTSFDGTITEGISEKEYTSILDEAWFEQVEGHVAIMPREHPRLLFRSHDLPELRRRMNIPEGQAILKRLRFLLDGANGNSLPSHYNEQTEHTDDKAKSPAAIQHDAGVYTFSHAAGYGLLYQLTGEQKYADLGQKAFEMGLDGQRDRDNRYSFRKPGGGLRAGPVLGWMAIGYDLCYNGWTPEFQERATRAIAEYYETSTVHLESLARGTRPPGSNHFGAQVGGASIALLAVDGEPWVDQERIDVLLRIVQRSMIRNVVEGFGDGGVFQEGDGPGSMASNLSYLTGLQAWKQAKGLDMVNNGRMNVPMTTLKWIYLSRVSPEAGLTEDQIWDLESIDYPIRGKYPHNVWGRDGLSGAGYFSMGFAGITPEQQEAHLWFYNEFLHDVDQRIGRPFDTVSVYPHLAVSAFVNWPFERTPVNPEEVLPRITADTTNSFYIWRSRWQDESDFIMSLLTKRTQGGYMKVNADKTLNVDGRPWAKLEAAGEVQGWWVAETGDHSRLTFEKDLQTLLVDFTGESGEEVLLATTLPGKEGETVELGSQSIRLLFPRSTNAPEITVTGETVQIGEQILTLSDGMLTFQ